MMPVNCTWSNFLTFSSCPLCGQKNLWAYSAGITGLSTVSAKLPDPKPSVYTQIISHQQPLLWPLTLALGVPKFERSNATSKQKVVGCTYMHIASILLSSRFFLGALDIRASYDKQETIADRICFCLILQSFSTRSASDMNCSNSSLFFWKPGLGQKKQFNPNI